MNSVRKGAVAVPSSVFRSDLPIDFGIGPALPQSVSVVARSALMINSRVSDPGGIPGPVTMNGTLVFSSYAQRFPVST